MTFPTVPVGVAATADVPHGRTATRLEWRFLPPDVRALVESRLGGSVVEAVSQGGGYTPGFASVLTTSTGVKAFVKAASRAAQREIAESYAEEGRKLEILDGSVPAPRLLWAHDDGGWVVLCLEAVEARQPRRPWQPPELDRALDLAEEIAAATIRPPEGLGLRPITDDLPALVTGWSTVPGAWPRRAEAAVLAAQLPALPDADRFVHSDLRDDNILFVADGRTLACDWNWPALGPAWLDLVVLLVSAHGDGLDVEPYLRGRDLTRDVPSEAVDAWLAALCGFMLSTRTRPVPPSSPHVRQHANWYAEAAWSWLAERRNWT
jgi:hypothetical protein